MPADADPVEWGKDRSLREAREVLGSMHVTFDAWSSEAAIVAAGAMDEVLAELRAAGHVYEADGAVWLRTTTFGDDQDRVLVRSDGEPTYFLPDIAYHRDKYNRGDHLIDILGADHHGYVGRMRAALQALGNDPDTYEVIIGQNVRLLRNGQEVKMSKRAGTIVEIRDVIDVVGPDVARFAYLLQSVDSPQTLDLDVLTAQAAENPVYYVQYANARIHSIGRTAAERGIERRPLADADLSLLAHDREIELLRELSSAGGGHRERLQRPGPPPDRHLGPVGGGRVPRLLPQTARCCATTSTPTSNKLGCGSPRRPASGSPSGSTCSA